MKNYILPSLLLCLLTACNQEEINTDSYGITEKEYRTTGGLAYGTTIQSMQQKVIPIGSPALTTGPGNKYQATDLISSGNYIGYFGNNNNWGFTLEATWKFPDNRTSLIYDVLYTDIYSSWMEIKKLVGTSTEPSDLRVMAVADLIRIISWIRATDVFGPIVYTHAGRGDIAPKLDPQSEVYRQMLEDLAKISKTLNMTPDIILADYDLIYGGDATKWCKLANSMMLRLAVRTHFIDESLAKKYIELALNPNNGGVMETVSDQAAIGSSTKMALLNPMTPSVKEYNETRMGLSIWSYLIGYQDHRVSAYFTTGTYEGKTGYYAIAPTNMMPNRSDDEEDCPRFASMPNFEPTSPVYWMRPSEVYFLRAEAALYGLSGENAKDLYNKGIKTSFEEWGADGSEEYIKSKRKPADMRPENYEYGQMDYPYSCNISQGNVSPLWDDIDAKKDSKEQQLQKIMTQKYIALYPNAIEAWTEYRRTGYPYLMKPYYSKAYQEVGGTPDMITPERIKFASTEYDKNPNMKEVPQLLGGQDNGATRQWWVRKNRPKQSNN